MLSHKNSIGLNEKILCKAAFESYEWRHHACPLQAQKNEHNSSENFDSISLYEIFDDLYSCVDLCVDFYKLLILWMVYWSQFFLILYVDWEYNSFKLLVILSVTDWLSGTKILSYFNPAIEKCIWKTSVLYINKLYCLTLSIF